MIGTDDCLRRSKVEHSESIMSGKTNWLFGLKTIMMCILCGLHGWVHDNTVSSLGFLGHVMVH